MPPRLSQLSVYPIKSTAPLQLSRCAVTSTGLAFDRQFVLCDPEGKFLTARTLPQLLKIQTSLLLDSLIICAPHSEPLTLEYSSIESQYDSIKVWKDEIDAVYCGAIAERWFSRLLQRPCKLYFFGDQSHRSVADSPESQVAFADGYPLLLISQASLTDLNTRCKSTVLMEQMRPNLVIENTLPYAEDGWKRLRIGTVEFEVAKPCGRCVLTTVDPDTLVRNPDREPFSVLKQYRKGSDGQAHFGQNLIALNQGVISQGDTVEVLETGAPEIYLTV